MKMPFYFLYGAAPQELVQEGRLDRSDGPTELLLHLGCVCGGVHQSPALAIYLSCMLLAGAARRRLSLAAGRF